MDRRAKYAEKLLGEGKCSRGCGGDIIPGRATCAGCVARAADHKRRRQLRAKWREQKRVQKQRKKNQPVNNKRKAK